MLSVLFCGGGKMKGKEFSCAAEVTGLTAAFFCVLLFGALYLGKVLFVHAVFPSPVLAVVVVSRWNELARRLMLRLSVACVAALAVVFVALQVAGVTLFHTDTVGMLYMLLGLVAVFIATLIVTAKFPYRPPSATVADSVSDVGVEVTWGRATKVLWSIMWRGWLFSFIVVVFIMGAAAALSQRFAIVGKFVGVVVCIPVWIWVVRNVLQRSWSDFRIALLAVARH